MSWNRTLVRTHDQDARCAHAGDDQPCSGGPAAYILTANGMIMGRPRTEVVHLCSNHAARAAQKHGLAFPTVRA